MNLKYVAILLLGIGLAFLYFFINPKEVDFMPKCILYSSTGLYCPGCGSQRATYQLLHLNIVGILQQNILYLIGLLIIGYHLTVTGLNKFFKTTIYNYIYHPKTPIVILVIVILFWILRNIPFYPFTILAPK